MIELTDEQLRAMSDPDTSPPRLVNPRANETFVLLPADEYERLKAAGHGTAGSAQGGSEGGAGYDDSPWTREELHALACEAGKRSAGWEGIDEYDGNAAAGARQPFQ